VLQKILKPSFSFSHALGKHYPNAGKPILHDEGFQGLKARQKLP
jgi:hypothetical protein